MNEWHKQQRSAYVQDDMGVGDVKPGLGAADRRQQGGRTCSDIGADYDGNAKLRLERDRAR